MNRYYLSIGGPCLKNTPKSDIRPSEVSQQLGKSKRYLTIQQIANAISKGYSFCPATFRNNIRSNENVEQMQLFALDFDGDKKTGKGCPLSYENALKRAEECHIPVVMSYETKSSVNRSSYRLIFLYNSPVYDVRLMKLITHLLYYVFPESDRMCKDLARMFYPGKEVMVHSEEYFFLDELIISAQTIANEKSKDTWNNYLNTVQKETQIVTIKNSILIGFSPDDYPEFSPLPIKINMVLEQNRGNSDEDFRQKNGYIFFSDINSKPVKHDSPKIKNSDFYIKHNNPTEQSERCRLYREFISGERKLPHNEWFGLCTNMIYLNNGQAEFMRTIRKYPELYNNPERKYYQMKYVVNHCYFPTRCESYCPYSDCCIHKQTAIQTMKNDLAEFVKISGKIYDISLDELHMSVYSEIENAICSSVGNTVIKTQTGSGKTTAALKAIQKVENKVIMAFPNSALMQEVYFRAVDMGINVTVVPTTEELNYCLENQEMKHISDLYSLGTEEMVSEYLKTLAPQNPQIREYLKRIDKALSSNDIVFMTHARLMTLGENALLDTTIVIDEDIFQTMIQIKKADVDALRNAVSNCDNNKYIYKIQNILNQCDGKSRYISSEALYISREESRYFINKFCDDNAQSCIIGVLRAGLYYYDANENTLNFLVKKSFPDSYKRCIMLSATADEDIHSILFPHCRFVELPEAAYRGKVIQNHSQNFSRYYFEKDPSELFGQIVEEHRDCNFITFKKFMSCIDVPNDRKMYFGKALGINSFSGKDLVVIGTPHLPEFVYLLVAENLGKNACKGTLAQRKLTRNGYSFHMMTFKDEFMQKIQTYFIESELEQAVGRARLLDNDCTVFVYSRYPVRQCALVEELEKSENNL